MARQPNLHRWMLVATLATLSLSGNLVPSKAADLPADCSQATIPDQPAKGKFAGKDFVANTATFSTINHPVIEGVNYDSYDLYLRGKDQAGEGMLLVVNTIVPENALPDSKSFALLPINDATKQPTVGPGAAGIQGWTLEDDATGLNSDNSTEIASLRLEYGARTNDTLIGQIYFCAPGVKGSFVAGSFSIDVSQ
jgi:hypothetical protein